MKELTLVEMIPLYKKRCKDEPECYCPSTVTLHARKAINRIIAEMLMGTYRSYSYSDTQLRFWELTCTETATTQHIWNGQNLKHNAGPDFKLAHNMVPWKVLMKLLERKIGRNIDTLEMMTFTHGAQYMWRLQVKYVNVQERIEPKSTPIDKVYLEIYFTELKNSQRAMYGSDQNGAKWSLVCFANNAQL